jgi:Ran GTPase-activating protein 1
MQYLNINDMFVGRLKDEIPKSIEHISKGLVGSGLLQLDISSNAVNPYGAEALLIYLSQAASLQVLLIYNCGLGPMGVAKIAEGFKGTPSLKTLSIGRNRMEDEGILSIAENLSFVPQLEELFVYQNTLKEKGLTLLFKNLREHCKSLNLLDLCDNFVRGTATKELVLLLQEVVTLRNLNLSDCLKEEQNPMVVEGFKVHLHSLRPRPTGNGSVSASTSPNSMRISHWNCSKC